MSTTKSNTTVLGVPENMCGNGSYNMHRDTPGLLDAVARCMRALKAHPGFDTIYVSGHSGIVPGSVCAWRLKKNLMILRKRTDDSHGSICQGDAWWSPSRVILLDDFISTGETFVRMMSEVDSRSGSAPKIVGVIFYGHHVTQWEKEHGYVQTRTMLEAGYTLARKSPKSHLFTLGRTT